jgi:hypothetical protein
MAPGDEIMVLLRPAPGAASGRVRMLNTAEEMDILPGGYLIARQLMRFEGNGPGRQEEIRWAWEIHGAHNIPEPEACCFEDGTCAELTPSECVCQGGTPQGLGTVCDSDGDGVDDACVPPCVIAGPVNNDPVPSPVDVGFGTRNRYLSFTGGDPGRSQAVRVTLTNLPEFPYANGRMAWVQEPYLVTEASGGNGPAPPPTMWAARLGCDPWYTDWSVYGTVHVFDAGIVPGSRYRIQLLDSTCDCADPADYGPPLTIDSSAIGDVVGDCAIPPCTAPQGVIDFVDISSIVEKFKNTPGAPRKARADIINSDVAQPVPDQKVDFVDISYCVEAFRNTALRPPGPATADPCPAPCP